MTIQNDPDGKVMLAPTSHLVEDEFNGYQISFLVNDSFIDMKSHAGEVFSLQVYAPGCDPEYLDDDINEATLPSISLLCDDVAYEACEEFKHEGTVSDSLEFKKLSGTFLFKAKMIYYHSSLIYFYGFDMAGGEWDNTALCVIYPREYEGTNDEKRLIAALDEAAESYREV